MKGRSALSGRLMVILVTLVSGVLGAGLLAGYGGAGVARGTSEALGYPTNTPPPPPAAPTATTVIAPPTSTMVVVPPTATMTVVPPTATTVPATVTPVPPTASSTAIPSTPIPTSTSSATSVPTARATPSPRPASLSVFLSSPVVASGDTLTVQVHTLPLLTIQALVRYPGLCGQMLVKRQADRHGLAQLRIPVSQSPRKGSPSLKGLIVLTVNGRGYGATRTAAFTVYPSLRLVVTAKLVTVGKSHQVAVSVSLARAAQIEVRLVLSGPGKRVIDIHQSTARGTRLSLAFPVAAHHGPESANLQVTVRTREGVTERRGLVLRVSS